MEEERKRKTGMVAAVGLVLAIGTALAMSVTAQNLTPYNCVAGGGGSWHCFSRYDLAVGGDFRALREDCDLIGGCPVSDSHLDIGGVLYDGCLSQKHANNGGSPSRDWPHCAWTKERYYIVDDFFGGPNGVFGYPPNPSAVGGVYCTDNDNDGVCGEAAAGERFERFCGHIDLGHVNGGSAFTLAYLVDGPLFQPQDCPGSPNTIGGTTGTLSIWLTPAPPPQCADGVDNGDLDPFPDWPADPGCAGPWDNDETSACEDGVDNDGDGIIDWPADPGCANFGDNTE